MRSKTEGQVTKNNKRIVVIHLDNYAISCDECGSTTDLKTYRTGDGVLAFCRECRNEKGGYLGE